MSEIIEQTKSLDTIVRKYIAAAFCLLCIFIIFLYSLSLDLFSSIWLSVLFISLTTLFLSRFIFTPMRNTFQSLGRLEDREKEYKTSTHMLIRRDLELS